MKSAFIDIIKLSANHDGKIPKLIDEHYVFWCYSYHREGKPNPMSTDRWKRKNVILIAQVETVVNQFVQDEDNG